MAKNVLTVYFTERPLDIGSQEKTFFGSPDLEKYILNGQTSNGHICDLQIVEKNQWYQISNEEIIGLGSS